MEKIDNFGESNKIEEDKGSISEPKTHTMAPPTVINKGRLIQELLPVHA
jgi:hypothetical protein